jgi:TonB family protein
MRGIHCVEEEASAFNLIGDARLAALAAALLAIFGSASAQQPPPAESSARAGVSERVMRDAESPMRWIKMHSETLRRSEESRKLAAATAAASAAPPSVVASPPVATSSRSAAAKASPSAATAKPQRLAQKQEAPASAASEPAAAARVDSAVEERSLVTVDRAEPEWDEDVIRSLRKGRVVVRFIVAEDGYLSRIQIVESTSSKLTGPAMAAVMQWRFEPIAEPRVATVEFGFDMESGKR